MERPPPRKAEAKDGKPERSIEAPSAVWWMLAVLAIIAFSALAFLFGRAS
jgi:hypothetical protein